VVGCSQEVLYRPVLPLRPEWYSAQPYWTFLVVRILRSIKVVGGSFSLVAPLNGKDSLEMLNRRQAVSVVVHTRHIGVRSRFVEHEAWRRRRVAVSAAKRD